MSHQTSVLECFAWFKLCNSDLIASSSFGALQIFIIIWSLNRFRWRILVTIFGDKLLPNFVDNKLVTILAWSYLEPLNFWLFIGRAPNCLMKFSHRPWRLSARSVEIKSESKINQISFSIKGPKYNTFKMRMSHQPAISFAFNHLYWILVLRMKIWTVEIGMTNFHIGSVSFPTI